MVDQLRSSRMPDALSHPLERGTASITGWVPADAEEGRLLRRIAGIHAT